MIPEMIRRAHAGWQNMRIMTVLTWLDLVTSTNLVKVRSTPKSQIQGKLNLFELLPFFVIHRPARLIFFSRMPAVKPPGSSQTSLRHDAISAPRCQIVLCWVQLAPFFAPTSGWFEWPRFMWKCR
jgi:hypothetical protein